MRLISAGKANDIYLAGVEILLKDKAHTYWRNPGDGGVPPEFNFSGSSNLKSAVVKYPAPHRSGEPGMYLFGYENEVIFPITVTPADPGKAVKLVLHLNYAACEKICMPAEAKVQLELKPGAKDNVQRARIEKYLAMVPRKDDIPGAPRLTISTSEAGKSWRVKVAPAPGKSADLFAEGPNGWFFDTQRLPGGDFEIKLAEQPEETKSAGKPLPPVTLTLTGENGAWESVRHLDAAPATP